MRSYRPHFLHAKHLSVDDDIALVGSINLDIRSFALNAEIGLLCYDAGVVARMRDVESDYLANADIVAACMRGNSARLASQPRGHRAPGGFADVSSRALPLCCPALRGSSEPITYNSHP